MKLKIRLVLKYIYLRNKEKIKITKAIANTVLIIKFFLSETAIKISLASLVTTMYPASYII